MDRKTLAAHAGAPSRPEPIAAVHGGGDQSAGGEGFVCHSGKSEALCPADRR